MLRRSSPWFSLVMLAIAAGCSGQIANVAEPVDGGEATDSGRTDSGRDSSPFEGGGVCAPANVSAFQPPA